MTDVLFSASKNCDFAISEAARQLLCVSLITSVPRRSRQPLMSADSGRRQTPILLFLDFGWRRVDGAVWGGSRALKFVRWSSDKFEKLPWELFTAAVLWKKKSREEKWIKDRGNISSNWEQASDCAREAQAIRKVGKNCVCWAKKDPRWIWGYL